MKTIDVIPYACEHKGHNSQFRVIKAAAEFPSRLKAAHNDTIRIREGAIYRGTRHKVAVVCMVCGHEWLGNPGKMIGKQKSGCPECFRLSQINLAGRVGYKVSTPDEKLKAQEMRESGISFKDIANELGRSESTIFRWLLDPEAKEKYLQKERDNYSVRQASGIGQKVKRAYQKSSKGRAVRKAAKHKRRGLEYHCRDIVFIPDHPEADYQGFVSFDMWNDYVKGDDIAMELFSFEGADEDVKRRKVQQDKLTKISGEPYSLEHLIPMSRNGIHHPYNFANRALALNLQKNNKLLTSDIELFCRRLFA